MSDEVLCHLCCEVMPAPGLENHLATAHGEESADAGGGEATAAALGKGDDNGESEMTMVGVGLEVSDMDRAEQQLSSGYARANANEREFNCDKCSFSTPFKHSLKTHMLTHTYDCVSCPFKAVNKKLLLQHMQTNHSDHGGDGVGGQQEDRITGVEGFGKTLKENVDDVEILLGYLGSDDEEQEMKDGEDFSYLAVAVVDNMAKVDLY